MKIKIRKLGEMVAAITIATTLVLAGCGGSSSSSPAAAPGSSNLKGALFTTVNSAPVASNIVQRQAGAAGIVGAIVNYVADKTGIAGFDLAQITVATATTDANGIASIAVPAGTYTSKLSALPADLVSGENAPYSATETVTASGTKTYQADQYAVVITSPNTLASVTVEVYQTDAVGTIDWGNQKKYVDPVTGVVTPNVRNPIVFSKTTTLAGVTTDTENVELFKGNYRIVVQATATAAVAPATTPILAPYISPVITVAGGGLTINHPVTLAAPSYAPTITLKNYGGSAGLAGYSVQFFENVNHILLGTAVTDVNGTASVGAAAGVTGVVARIYAPTTNAYSGVYIWTNIATSSSATLQQYKVLGTITPTGGSLDATSTTAQVYAVPVTGLGRYADLEVASAPATVGTGTYVLTLFGGTPTAMNYKLAARNVKNFPDATKLPITVNSADLVNQNIAVAPGGVILGRIQTEGLVDLPNVTVEVYGTAPDGIIDLITSQLTAVDGTYSLQVPYGTYFLLVNGAVSDGLVVSPGAPTLSKNLVQFQMTGQVSKSTGATTAGANAATVRAGTTLATASSLGIYTIKVMEGKNWICAMPSPANDPTYGYNCNLNVLVDKASVAAARL